MKLTLGVDRILSALLLALLFAAYIHHDYTKWTNLGRDAFLANQSNRFDHHITQSHWIPMIIGIFIVISVFLVLYELLAALFGKFLNKPS